MNAWQRRAEEAAEFTEIHLVNRTDVWGGYTAPDHRIVDENGISHRTYTAPGKKHRGTRQLDHGVLVRHYRGLRERDVIGLHSTAPNNTSRWFGGDFDNHIDSPERAAKNLANALAFCDVLRMFGLAPLIEDSNGNGGLHVWVIFAEPAPTATVHAFLVATMAELGITAEVYPKQAAIAPDQFGNWLRIPGRHHTRDHWSRFLADGVWHEDEDAVELWLCAWTSSSAQLPIPQPRTIEAERPRAIIMRPTAPLDRRIHGYMAKLPSGMSAGDGRNDAGFLFACFLVRDLALSDQEALGWLGEWNRGHQTPMSNGKLASLIAEAHRYGRAPYGSALESVA